MCGVIGIIGSSLAGQEAYHGLLTLQHRGQDAAGILTFDSDDQQFRMLKKSGQVERVFQGEDLVALKGSLSIAHTRYKTIGENKAEDLQPLIYNHPYGLGIVHNGNLVNYEQIKEELCESKSHFFTSQSDLEVLAALIMEKLREQSENFSFSQLTKAAENVWSRAKGGYSIIGTIADEGLFGLRDPKGIRPLILGQKGKAYILASESSTIIQLGYKIKRDIAPGELVFISSEGNISSSFWQENLNKNEHFPCMFEWVYFSTPESEIHGASVYEARKKLGEALGRKLIRERLIEAWDIDIVTSVPETARISALSLAESVGLPYRESLTKNRYIQRSFILPNQKAREAALDIKLFPLEKEVRGKNILVVDDSIVRGSTSRKIISRLKSAGAMKVFFASTCPPIKHPCYFGIDFPSKEELLAPGLSYEQIAKRIGADDVLYLDLEDLLPALGVPQACMACLNGEYPVSVESSSSFEKLRKKQKESFLLEARL